MTDRVERSYLEIKSINELLVKNKPFNGLNLEKVNPPDFQLNKFFYKEIGKKHNWTDRLVWDDKKWINYLEHSGVNTYILKYNKDFIGYFEQILDTEKLDCEIAYFVLRRCGPGYLRPYITCKAFLSFHGLNSFSNSLH